MTYRLRNLGLAIALAAVAVLLVFYYVSQERGRLQEDQELVPVWVAAKDIPAGTSGARFTSISRCGSETASAPSAERMTGERATMCACASPRVRCSD